MYASLSLHTVNEYAPHPDYNKVFQPIRSQQWGSAPVIYQAGEGGKPKGPLLSWMLGFYWKPLLPRVVPRGMQV